MQALALLGGPKENWPDDIETIFKNARKKQKLIFASDRGSLFLKQWGINADVAVGDFDSLKSSEKETTLIDISDIRYSHPVKDYTDSEQLFLTALEDYKIDELLVYGATGGRLDHFFVNIFTFLKPDLKKYLSQISIIDKQNKVIFRGPGRHKIYRNSLYKYIGFGNIEEVVDFSIEGARYELNGFSCTYPTFFSSNEFLPDTEYFEVNLKKGTIIAIYSNDINRFS